MIVNKWMSLVAGFVLLAAGVYAADDEQPQSVDLARNFVFLAPDGAMTASADFRNATFHVLPKTVEEQYRKTPRFFENADNTLFAFYRGADGFWNCHLDASGWAVEKTIDFVFHKIDRVDENTFTAQGAYDREALEASEEVIETEVEVEVWTGAVSGRKVYWKKTGSTIITVNNSLIIARGCHQLKEVPEWETAVAAQNGDTLCRLQYRTAKKSCYRFQAGSSAAEPMTGGEFVLDEVLRPRSMEHFAWGGRTVDELQALLLMARPRADGKGAELCWWLCKRGGAECVEMFAKEWQGRELLKTLKPVDGGK